MKAPGKLSWIAASLAALCVVTGAEAPKAQRARELNIRHHDLDIRISPDTRQLHGYDRITFFAERSEVLSFYLGDFFEISRASVDGRRVKLERVEIDYTEGARDRPEGIEKGDPAADDLPENRVMYLLPAGAVAAGEHLLEIEYGGVVDDTLTVPEGSRSGIPSETTGLIDTEGTYLGGYPTGWYPDGRDDFARFSIRVTTPTGFEAVTEGKRSRVERTLERTVTDWEVGYPTQHVTLMAAKYVVRERQVDGITLMAYFFPSEKQLIDTYLDASESYVELYNKLIGPYPFSKFAVVENFFPTGYGMPSYTLLGRRIVRMPFIVRTSLGHEVAHNWWGNCVYPIHEKGNWCEGLTTYYADYRYESEKSDSAAAAYRHDILVNYATHVTDSTDMSLADFRSRDDPVSGVIGYGKCTMVFHMLKNHVGEDKFYRAMRNFYRQYRFVRADWKDIESVIEEVHGAPLGWFFDQWVYAAGAPRLSIDDVRLEEPPAYGGHYTIRAELGNKGGFILPKVPLEIVTPTVTHIINVPVLGEKTEFDWRLTERPLRLAVDPHSELFRGLSAAEVPVTVGRVLAEEAPVIVLPSGAAPEKAEAFRELAERLAAGSEETIVASDTAVATTDLLSPAVFVLGDMTENVAYLALGRIDSVTIEGGEIDVGGRRYTEPGHAAFVAYTNRLEPTSTVCAIVGNSADAVRKAGYKVIYYGKYGYVTFLDGDKQVAGVFPPPTGPLVHSFEEEGLMEGERGAGEH